LACSSQFTNLHSMEHVFEPVWLSFIPMINRNTQFSHSVRHVLRMLLSRWWSWSIKHMWPDLVPPEGWNMKTITWIHINMNRFQITNVSIIGAHLLTNNISEWVLWWNLGISLLTVLIFVLSWSAWLNSWSLVWWN